MRTVVVTLWRRYLFGCSEGIARIWLSRQPFLLQQFSMMCRETRHTVFARLIRQHFVGELTKFATFFVFCYGYFFFYLELNVFLFCIPGS